MIGGEPARARRYRCPHVAAYELCLISADGVCD